MFEIMERSTETCIGVKVKGKARAEDYKKLEPVMDNAIKAHGSVNMVIYLDDFEGYEDFEALKKDAQMGWEEYENINRVAVVGGKDWQKIAVKLLSPLTLDMEEKHFDPADIEAAWTWACNQPN